MSSLFASGVSNPLSEPLRNSSQLSAARDPSHFEESAGANQLARIKLELEKEPQLYEFSVGNQRIEFS
jgi:hypothetical protein